MFPGAVRALGRAHSGDTDLAIPPPSKCHHIPCTQGYLAAGSGRCEGEAGEGLGSSSEQSPPPAYLGPLGQQHTQGMLLEAR